MSEVTLTPELHVTQSHHAGTPLMWPHRRRSESGVWSTMTRREQVASRMQQTLSIRSPPNAETRSAQCCSVFQDLTDMVERDIIDKGPQAPADCRWTSARGHRM